MGQVQTHTGGDADALPRLFAAARWRRRLLARALRRLPADAREEERVLLECCASMLDAVVEGEIPTLLAAMQATSDAVQRAHAAGVEWTAIEGIAQRAWPLASDLFEAIGWAEAFRLQHASHEPAMMGAWLGECVDVTGSGVAGRGLRVVAGGRDARRP